MNLKRLLIWLILFSSCSLSYANEPVKFVIVTASYNNASWYQFNLLSVIKQNYPHWRMIYIDDCSPDNTGQLVANFIKKHGVQDKIKLIRNTSRQYGLANQYDAIHSCQNNEIIVNLDGDDWFANNKVLSYLSKIYSDPNIWLTYGQWISYPHSDKSWCRDIPADIVQRNAFREYTHIPSHLRTFYAGLFKLIKKKDLTYKRRFFTMTQDMATIIPMIEMARDHFKFIDKIFYIYNDANPINDHKVNSKLQKSIDLIIRSRKPYTPLTTATFLQ